MEKTFGKTQTESKKNHAYKKSLIFLTHLIIKHGLLTCLFEKIFQYRYLKSFSEHTHAHACG